MLQLTDVGVRRGGEGLLEHDWLEHEARFEQIDRVFRRQRRHDSTLMRVDDDQSFGLELQQRHSELTYLLAQNRRQRQIPTDLLSAKRLDTFSRALRSRLRNSRSGLRRAYVRHLVQSVVVGERAIEIRGSKSALLAAAADPECAHAGRVPSSVQEWRREWDSNPRYAFT